MKPRMRVLTWQTKICLSDKNLLTIRKEYTTMKMPRKCDLGQVSQEEDTAIKDETQDLIQNESAMALINLLFGDPE